MKIVSLTASNLMRLKAVEITPEGNTVVISGRNAQGKTSVLNAIWFALGGAPAQKATKRPVRDGEKAAVVRLDLGDIVVTRTWSGDESSKLTVTAADGARYTSPQAMLDKLIGTLAFDPLAWSTKADKAQLDDLLQLLDLGFDLDDHAYQRKALYESRTEINRAVRRVEQEVMRLAVAVETEPINVIELYAKLREYEDANRKIDAATIRRAGLKEQLTAALREMERLTALYDAAGEEVTEAGFHKDTQPLELKLEKAAENNAAANRWMEKQAAAKELAELTDQAAVYTVAMLALDQKKVEAVAAAKMPVPGLGFDDDGVTYEGVPFRQCSGAERLRVSLAMAMALNPTIRVIRITDGSLLDRENMAVVREMADTEDYQVWIERVEDDEAQFVIEDGAVSD